MKDRACGIILRNNKVMFIEQWYDIDDLRHMFVGGGVEENETPEQAVLRELHEEANITGKILFGPITVTKRRTEHIFILSIGDQEPTPGYDPEYAADDQDITNILWYDADDDIDLFNDVDIGYFRLVIEEAEKHNVSSEWADILKNIVSNAR